MDLKQSFSMDKIRDSLKSSKGKGIAAGLILVVVLLLVLLVVSFAIPQLDAPTALVVNKEIIKPLLPTPQVSATPSTGTVSSIASTGTGGAAGETDTVKYSDEITQFRDPFAPIVETTTTTGSKAVYTASALSNDSSDTAAVSAQSEGSTSGSEASSTGVSTGANNSISLKAISSQNGKRYGSFIYNGIETTATAGETINSSPYQVLDIGDGSATLLYGDDRLTLSVGNEIVK